MPVHGTPEPLGPICRFPSTVKIIRVDDCAGGAADRFSPHAPTPVAWPRHGTCPHATKSEQRPAAPSAASVRRRMPHRSADRYRRDRRGRARVRPLHIGLYGPTKGRVRHARRDDEPLPLDVERVRDCESRSRAAPPFSFRLI
jgi:hypothetical protein